MAAGIHPFGRYRGETVIWVALVSIVAVALSLAKAPAAAPAQNRRVEVVKQ